MPARPCGASPRVWGKRQGPRHRPGAPRCIPTRVGQTAMRRLSRGSGSVHPHACGANRRFLAWAGGAAGASPRVWGKRAGAGGAGAVARCIPTRVGQTQSASGAAGAVTVHPHACGANYIPRIRLALARGASPRVWGKRRARLPRLPRAGCIPTRVGQTFRTTCSRRSPAVHPHACGANETPLSAASQLRGASPRVWGKLREELELGEGAGCIPTRVGQTSKTTTISGANAVHPHACGANRPDSRSAARTSGASPRVWGKPASTANSGPVMRCIPTRVGQTLGDRERAAGAAVHPHACGANEFIAVREDPRYGASPRVWGKRRHRAGGGGRSRCIPTRVGQTRGRRGPV